MPSEQPSDTILSLASEIADVAHNINHRIGSVADSVGGTRPECAGKGSEPNSLDLHSVLQRILTTLRETQDEVLRCEKVIGVAVSNGGQSIGGTVGKPQMGKTLHQY